MDITKTGPNDANDASCVVWLLYFVLLYIYIYIYIVESVTFIVQVEKNVKFEIIVFLEKKRISCVNSSAISVTLLRNIN